jgi:hypothetical protein
LKARQQHKRIIGRPELRHRRSTILRKLNLSRTPLGKKCTSVLAFADGISQPYSRMSAETTCDRVFEISGHSHLAMTAGCEQGNVCPMSSQKFIEAWWLFYSALRRSRFVAYGLQACNPSTRITMRTHARLVANRVKSPTGCQASDANCDLDCCLMSRSDDVIVCLSHLKVLSTKYMSAWNVRDHALRGLSRYESFRQFGIVYIHAKMKYVRTRDMWLRKRRLRILRSPSGNTHFRRYRHRSEVGNPLTDISI